MKYINGLVYCLFGLILGVALVVFAAYSSEIKEAWNQAMLCKHDGTLTGINQDRTWRVDISKWTQDPGDDCNIGVCKDCGKVLDIQTLGRGYYSHWPIEGVKFLWSHPDKEIIHTCTPDELAILKVKGEMLDVINHNLRNGVSMKLRPEIEGAGLNVFMENGEVKREIKGIEFIVE